MFLKNSLIHDNTTHIQHEIKSAIKLLKNNKTCGVDNEFFEYCHNQQNGV